MHEKSLENLNSLGLIPGPCESKETFFLRANLCLNLRKKIKDQIGQDLPFNQDEKATPSILQKAERRSLSFYDMFPSWVPIFFSNDKLAPWYGGCTWVFQLEKHLPPLSFLQLRKHFATHNRYLFLYERDEIITHELAHIGRMAFNEPIFEEFLAYFSSKSLFRKYFGPIIQTPFEIYLLFFAIFFAFIGLFFTNSLLFFLFPLFLITKALTRLIVRHRQFSKCLNQLEALFPKKGKHLLYRLTDEEIISFSQKKKKNILKYIKNQTSFRWEFLKTVYQL